LARSSLPKGGACIEVGSGTGLQTAPLLEHFDHVFSVDLAPAMLEHTQDNGSLGRLSLGRVDASSLPIRDASVAAVAAVNMFLFPGEYLRVLRPGGRLIFVSTGGDTTPIYLSPGDVIAALRPWLNDPPAIASRVGRSTWTVVTKEEA
jgi:ubiquinone/menaquinone biosynthesis C-methylase UbiE